MFHRLCACAPTYPPRIYATTYLPTYLPTHTNACIRNACATSWRVFSSSPPLPSFRPEMDDANAMTHRRRTDDDIPGACDERSFFCPEQANLDEYSGREGGRERRNGAFLNYGIFSGSIRRGGRGETYTRARLLLVGIGISHLYTRARFVCAYIRRGSADREGIPYSSCAGVLADTNVLRLFPVRIGDIVRERKSRVYKYNEARWNGRKTRVDRVGGDLIRITCYPTDAP